MTKKNDPNVSYLRGTNRPDRLSADTSISINESALTEIPMAPVWLPNAHAVNEWYRLAPILIELKLLTPGSLSALAQLCALHGKVVQLYAAGESPGASMLGTLRNLHNDFGLSPMAQGKVKAESPKEEPKPNAFSGRGRKPA
jgi:phage terminase small subunit